MSEKKREVNAFGKRNPFTSIIKGNIGIIAVLIIMCVIVSIATDKFLTCLLYTSPSPRDA